MTRIGRARTRGTARRRAEDRGAALVEAAILLPTFFLLLFAIAEGALMLNGNLTLAATTQDGARAASTLGNAADADFQIVQKVVDTASAAPVTDMELVVVFKASGVNGSVPASCKAGVAATVGSPTNPGVGSCNVYTAADFVEDDPAEFDCEVPSHARFYCPTARKTAQTSPPDYLGVYVRMKHTYITGLFGASLTMERTTIVRLEPQALNE